MLAIIYCWHYRWMHSPQNLNCLLLINFHTWVLKFLQLFISITRIMPHKARHFFCSTTLLFGHKKWIELGCTLDKPPKHANHEQFHHTMKRLFYDNFTLSRNVILQSSCFDLLDTRSDSTISYCVFTLEIFIFALKDIIVREITWSTARGGIKLLDLLMPQQLHMIKREIKLYLYGSTTFTVACFGKWIRIWTSHTL